MLTGKQRRYLRGLGHHLQPVVMIGKEEVSDSVIAAIEEALDSHELIKIRLQDGCLGDRKEVAEELSTTAGAEIVQVLGRTILLYRQSDEPEISLPKG